MPFHITRSTALAARVAAALLVSVTLPASASAAVSLSGTNLVAAAANVVSAPAVGEMNAKCTEPASFKAFALFGDFADYSFAPGGSFEAGASGWSLTNASITTKNESLGIFAGAKSLFIKKRGRVVSPWFCVTPAHPTFRYVTYGGEIEMEIDYKVTTETDIDDKLVGETNGGSKWGPSAIHPLAVKIPASKFKKGVVARIVFEAEDDVYVDNVLVDPYRRG
jgi:hypothetical protein